MNRYITSRVVLIFNLDDGVDIIILSGENKVNEILYSVSLCNCNCTCNKVGKPLVANDSFSDGL